MAASEYLEKDNRTDETALLVPKKRKNPTSHFNASYAKT